MWGAALNEGDCEANLELDFSPESAKGDVLGHFEAPNIIRSGHRDFDDYLPIDCIPSVGVESCGKRGRRSTLVVRAWRVVFLAFCAGSINKRSTGHPTKTVPKAVRGIRKDSSGFRRHPGVDTKDVRLNVR